MWKETEDGAEPVSDNTFSESFAHVVTLVRSVSSTHARTNRER
jgi:hypothetical protein